MEDGCVVVVPETSLGSRGPVRAVVSFRQRKRRVGKGRPLRLPAVMDGPAGSAAIPETRPASAFPIGAALF
ncbi:MAG: hypothetical protein M1336_03485 [Deltaproteobacteria bacterium]|nr:hypothetical protein [Deltaproteobacteria bacterium]